MLYGYLKILKLSILRNCLVKHYCMFPWVIQAHDKCPWWWRVARWPSWQHRPAHAPPHVFIFYPGTNTSSSPLANTTTQPYHHNLYLLNLLGTFGIQQYWCLRILSYFNECKLLLTELASIDTLVFIQKHQLLIESPHQNKKRQAVLFLLFTQRAAPSSLTFKLHNSQLYSATYCHSHSHFWAYLAGRAGRAEAQCDHQLPTQNVDFQNDWLQQHNIQAGDCLVNSMWSSLLKL